MPTAAGTVSKGITTMSYAPPPQFSGYPQPGSPQGAYGYGYAPPPPRRGMIRIVLGNLGLLGSILVLLVLLLISGIIGRVRSGRGR